MSESYAFDLQDYARRELSEDVAEVIDAVRRRRDDAVRELAGRAHAEPPADFRLGTDEIRRCADQLSDALLSELDEAQRSIGALAQAQRDCLRDCETDSGSGLVLGVRHVPVQSAAVVAGAQSRAELAVLQTAIVLARYAGASRVVACVPPAPSASRTVAIAAAHLAGADEVYLLDGVHGVAALAVGIESLPRVDAVVTCGGELLAEAGRQLFGERALHVSGGGRELLMIADESADPERAARELTAVALAHEDARAVLVTALPMVATAIAERIKRVLAGQSLPVQTRTAWAQRGAIRVVADAAAACALADRYGFAHVRLLTDTPRWYLDQLRNCATVSAGTGPLPGAEGSLEAPLAVHAECSRQQQGLWIGHFLRAVTYCDWASDTGSGAPDGALLAQSVAALSAPAAS